MLPYLRRILNVPYLRHILRRIDVQFKHLTEVEYTHTSLVLVTKTPDHHRTGDTV